MTEKPQNWQQVRAKIERGESSDKIGGFDPAAAPLGIDDEAAGFPRIRWRRMRTPAAPGSTAISFAESREARPPGLAPAGGQ